MLTEQLKNEIREYALSGIPNEVVGLLVLVDDNLQLYKCKNISYHKTENATLNPFDYIRASKLGKIIAHFHSHPSDEKPSFTDYLNSINHNIYSIIYAVESDKWYIIEPKLKDYLNNDFQIGVNDCFELVRNYYKNELNIYINSYNRQENWNELNPNILLDKYEIESFRKIELKDIKLHDIIIFNINGRPQHLSIYLGDNFILHHPHNDKSIISELTGSLLKRINIVIRHKNL